MKQRNANGRFDARSNLVHGVRTKNEEVRTGRLQRTRCTGKHISRSLPFSGALQSLDLVEVDAVENQLRGMKPTQALSDRLVDLAVVRNGPLPAHATDQTDDLQARAFVIGGQLFGLLQIVVITNLLAALPCTAATATHKCRFCSTR